MVGGRPDFHKLQSENHTQEKGDVSRKLSFKLSMVNAIVARTGSTMKGRQAMEDLAKVSAFITGEVWSVC